MISNFTFSEHLQDLLDIISILHPQETHQLQDFTFFIHHRAYRKLAWRVQEFSSHWGQSPFNILSAHLGPGVHSMDFSITYRDQLFQELIRNFCKGSGTFSSSETGISRDVYCVNAENALEWVATLKYIWGQLEDSLLKIPAEPFTPTVAVGNTNTAVKNTIAAEKPPRVKKNTPIRKTSPDPFTVITIVSAMFSLEALTPVFLHLLTAEGIPQALANAG